MPYSSEEYKKAYRKKYAATKNAKRREKYANDPEYREKMKALARSWWNNPEYKQKRSVKNNAYNRERYASDPEHKNRVLEVSDRWRALDKLKALSHYGKNGILLCCWDQCAVSDIDMLTLDHVKNDGASHRRELGGKDRAGPAIYRWVIRNKFPEGFQTLCCNHQFKKEILRKKALREKRREGIRQKKLSLIIEDGQKYAAHLLPSMPKGCECSLCEATRNGTLVDWWFKEEKRSEESKRTSET